jgi:hypothetical protein
MKRMTVEVQFPLDVWFSGPVELLIGANGDDSRQAGAARAAMAERLFDALGGLSGWTHEGHSLDQFGSIRPTPAAGPRIMLFPRLDEPSDVAQRIVLGHALAFALAAGDEGAQSVPLVRWMLRPSYAGLRQWEDGYDAAVDALAAERSAALAPWLDGTLKVRDPHVFAEFHTGLRAIERRLVRRAQMGHLREQVEIDIAGALIARGWLDEQKATSAWATPGTLVTAPGAKVRRLLVSEMATDPG